MSAGHDYGEEVYFGDGGDDPLPSNFVSHVSVGESKLQNEKATTDDNSSEVDEAELQDQVDPDDPPTITV